MQKKYKGSVFGTKLLLLFYKVFGYWLVKAHIYIIAYFYAHKSKEKLKELTPYYTKQKLPQTFSTYYRHIFAFSLNLIDRLLASKDEGYRNSIDYTISNPELFYSFIEEGGIILASHFGHWGQTISFFSTLEKTIHLTYLETLDQKFQELEAIKEQYRAIAFINLSDGLKASMQIAQALAKKEVVVLMVDRLNSEKNSIEVEFLQGKARFNKTPFTLMQNMDVALLGINAIRTGDKKVLIHTTDIIRTDNALPKDEAITTAAQRYSDFLAHDVQAYPYQWYNFHSVWKES